MVKQYQEKATSTSVFGETAIDGLPYPIVTICPKGSGIRCDCQLWKRLTCRYHRSNITDVFQFGHLTCEVDWIFSSPQEIEATIDELCSKTWNDLVWSNNNCGKILVSEQELYERVVARQIGGYPYLSMEETITYGACLITHVLLSCLLIILMHTMKLLWLIRAG
mmetsp:Transcript_45195/g.54803  ORF Transcript_45195/g.54803 Transcript_45195/m.54803 type:complete len:165 (+) Transcript_45195:269-763(+)